MPLFVAGNAKLVGELAKPSSSVQGLAELLGRHPELLPPNAPSVLQRSLLLCEDEYARVRKAALGVLRVALPCLERAGTLAPQVQSIRLRLQSALSHPERLVRIDALQLLQLLLQQRPAALVPPPALLLPALSEMLSAGAPAGDRAAATALSLESGSRRARSRFSREPRHSLPLYVSAAIGSSSPNNEAMGRSSPLASYTSQTTSVRWLLTTTPRSTPRRSRACMSSPARSSCRA